MLFPAEISAASPESWCVVITYDEDGYVKDDEAASINYDDLLKEMQEGTREANQERTKQGYEAVELIGWAAPPSYDQAAHKLYWAKELSFGAGPEHTLNYDIRAGVDKVAAYGIGGLIAGKLAAKAGLFKLLLVFAAKFWKLLAIAAVVIGVLVKKLLSGRRKEETAPSVAE
ncbi:MAG: DUF2167 domain-containing protein [Acidobacteria bacterium]|nr:DUF2167 domain-containing protein [Acidobacteriota bacterium]